MKTRKCAAPAVKGLTTTPWPPLTLLSSLINVLEEFLRAEEYPGADVMGRPLSSLLFADDVMLLAYTAADLQYLLNRLKI